MMRKHLRELRAWAKLLATGGRFQPTVLMYHSIGLNCAHFTVTPDTFQSQLALLKVRGIEVLDFENFLRRSLAGETGKIVTLTFDDGYKDFLVNAWPILCEAGFPATVFLMTGRMDESYEASGGATIPLLSWDEVAGLQREGVSFGSHSATHPKLTKIPLEEARKEIFASRDAIREKLGIEALYFCYPHGRETSEIRKLVRDAGYFGAVTVAPGHTGQGTDLFAIPRAYIHSEMGLKEFEACLV